jgi:glycosyltransferase involved in cell wall biosynthesis
MVNDGSTDSSADICARYQSIDNRFKLINKVNGGVSTARNIGLEYAIGDWVAFVDADDYVDPDYLTIPENVKFADVIEKGYTIKGKSESESICISGDSIILAGNELDSYFCRYVDYKTRALWNKIIKRNIIGNVEFRYAITMGEDFIFFLECYPAISKYALSTIGRYYYCENENSATEKNKINLTKRINGLLTNGEIVMSLVGLYPQVRIYSYVLFSIYICILNQYEKLLSIEQRLALLELKRSLLKADLSLLGYKIRIILFLSFLKEYLMIKINRNGKL